MTSSTATPTPANYSAGHWTIDAVHSNVGFVVRHAMVSKVRGKFTTYDAAFTTAENILDSTIEATIDVTSIDTGTEMRDNHIRSADFFDADNHPKMTFKSTGVRFDGGDYFVDGDLTIRGVTKPVTLAIEDAAFGPGMDGTPTVGFTATTEINRNDFGVSYNGPIPGGGSVISDKVQIVLDIEAHQDK